MTTDRAANMAIIALAACAVVLTAQNVHRFGLFRRDGRSVPAAQIEEWQSYANRGNRIGTAAASVTVVAFSDYLCPYCRELAVTVAGLQQRYRKDLAVVWRHLPLGTSRVSLDAALAAECAAKQERFEKMHIELFQNVDSLGRLSFARLAARAGIKDTVRFGTCMRDTATAKRIAEDVAAAEQLEAFGTPTILINGNQFNGLPSDLSRLIREERDKGSSDRD